MAIDVIIPVFNRPDYTKACLDSVYDTDHGVQIAPIVVDNGSRRRTAELIKEWAERHVALPEAKKAVVAAPRVLTMEKNLGFAGAINAALDAFPPEGSVVFLHNDTIVFPGWAVEMLACLDDSSDEIAVVVPRTSYANETGPCIPEIRQKFQAMKPNNKSRLEPEEIFSLIGKLYPEGKDSFVESLREQARLPSAYLPEISCFCMMTKARFLNEFGKFDPDFWPRGFEDKFWARSFERKGYVCVVANRAYVHHWGNATSDGPGFSFPDVMKVNGEKYHEKCLKSDTARKDEAIKACEDALRHTANERIVEPSTK